MCDFLNNRNTVDLGYQDLSKAFGLVSPGKSKKLEEMGINKELLIK